MRIARIVLFAMAFATGTNADAGHNLLANAEFAQAGASGARTMLSGSSVPGPAAAEHWTAYNNGDALTTTSLAPSTRRHGGTMIHVVTRGGKPDSGSGIVQAFLPVSTGPGRAQASAWVFINKGTVFIGTGNGGKTGIDARSSRADAWLQLRARNGVAPANLFIIYGQSPGADFFVDEADVEALTPAQAPDFAVTKTYLEADPVLYEGHCPTTIRAYGTISANGPGTVLCTFVRGDGTPMGEQKIVFDDAGSRPVGATWRVGNFYGPMNSYPGWAAIKILVPNGPMSKRAAYVVTC